MPMITYIEHDGTAFPLEIPEGWTVMEGGVMNDVSGIQANCFGDSGCATCHVYIDDSWLEKLAPPGRKENETLRYAFERQPSSRLSCQITVSAELDGLIVRLPSAQY